MNNFEYKPVICFWIINNTKPIDANNVNEPQQYDEVPIELLSVKILSHIADENELSKLQNINNIIKNNITVI